MRYGVVHDGQAVGLHALDLQQAVLDMHRVVANRPVQQRHDGDREQGESAVNLERNPDHADQGHAGLRQRLNGQNQRSGCRRLEVDRVHQSCGADLIAIGDRQALGMPEQLTAKVGDDALLQFRVHVTDEHVERGADDGDDESGDDGQRQQQEPVRLESGEQAGGVRQRRLTDHVVDEDLERPWREQTKRRGGYRQPDRADGKPPIWPDVRQEPPEVSKHQTSTGSDGIARITQWPRWLRCPA